MVLYNSWGLREKTKTKRDANLPNIVLGCAVKMEGSTTNLVLSTMSVTRSEVLTLRAPSLPFSYTNTISPPALQLPSELDWLLFLLLVPMLTTEPLGDVFWGRGLLGRDELWSFSRSSVATRWKEKKQEIKLEIYTTPMQFVSFQAQSTSIREVKYKLFWLNLFWLKSPSKITARLWDSEVCIT